MVFGIEPTVAGRVDVQTSTTEALITMASIMLARIRAVTEVTLASLGLDGLSVTDLAAL